MTSKRAALILTLVLLAPPAAFAGSPTLERIKTSGVVRFAYRDHAEPFSYKARDERVRGYSVELCERIAVELGKALSKGPLKIEWQAVDASTRFDVVSAARADVECGSSTITLSRMEKVDFTIPVFVDGGTVLVRADAAFRRVGDLEDRKVAVIAGTTTEQGLTRELASAGIRATMVHVKDAAEGVAQLEAGKVDGYAGDRIVLMVLRERAIGRANLALLENDFSYEPYALVVRRDDPDFRLAVNRALVSIYRSGAIDGIFQRWFGWLGEPSPLLHAMFYLNRLPD